MANDLVLSQVFISWTFRYAALLVVMWRRGGMIDFKGSHFETEIILWGVRWYVAYPISYRQLEEMMQERGVSVDHSTLNRWVIKYAPGKRTEGEREIVVAAVW